MSKKILLTTTAAIALAAGLTAAQAQSSSQDRTQTDRVQNSQTQSGAQSQNGMQSPTGAQSTTQQNDRKKNAADRAQNSPSSSSPSSAGSSSSTPSPSGSSAQSTPTPKSSTNTAQSPSTSPNGSQAGTSSQPSNRQGANDSSTNRSSSSGTNSPNTSRSSSDTSRSPNSSAQSQSPSNSNSSANTAQSSDRNARAAASVNLNDQQRTRISAAISNQKIAPATNVNFSISVGTRVPRSVHLHTISADVVSIVPQYRGYSYFVTNDQIVIVEPRTYQIVSVLPYGGGSGRAASAHTTKQTSSKFSSAQRETIKKQISSRPARTTVTRTREIAIGDEVPDTVILEEMPETIYTEVPGARPYRYYRTDRDVVIVDPSDRHIVDVLD